MKDEFEYKNIKMTDINEMEIDLKKFMSEDAYDVFLHCDDNFWLGDDGKIYEFEYIPCEEQFIRLFDSWEEFNEIYPR